MTLQNQLCTLCSILRSVIGPVFYAETIATVTDVFWQSDRWRKTLWTFPTRLSKCTKCQTSCKNLQQIGEGLLTCGLWPLHSPNIFPCYMFLWWCLKEAIHTGKNSRKSNSFKCPPYLKNYSMLARIYSEVPGNESKMTRNNFSISCNVGT